MAIDLKRRGFADRVIGVESDPVASEAALRMGLADEIVSFEDCVRGSDIVVVAVPVGTAVKMLPRVLDIFMEDGFGGAKTDPRHREKFNGTYSDMLKKCRCLKDNNPSYKDFLKNYQLYRNVLRITDKHKYTIFITAKGNAKTYTQLDAFLKNINDEYKGNVIALYWEDLIEKGHPLFDKYIAV